MEPSPWTVYLVRPSLIVVGIDGNTGHIDPRAAEKLLIDISNAIDRTVDYVTIFARPVIAVAGSKIEACRRAVAVLHMYAVAPDVVKGIRINCACGISDQ